MKTSTTTGQEYSKAIPRRNLLLTGKDDLIKYNQCIYSVFRKTMNVEADYFEEFQGKSKA
jgi:hypothetical protein